MTGSREPHEAENAAVYGLWLLEELAEHGHRLSPGTLYPILARMERNGWLRATTADVPANARKNYRITPRGRRVLAALRADVQELHCEIVLGLEPRRARAGGGGRAKSARTGRASA